jgi:hypothetical protein
MIDINLNPTKKQLRTFSVLFVLFAIFVGWSVARKSAFPASGVAVAAVGSALGLFGIAIPVVIRPVYLAMTIASFPIGWVVSHVLMAFIFYFVVTPVGLIMRLTGRDPLERHFDRSAATYWKPRRIDSDSSRYFRQF